MTDKNFEISCKLADKIYWKFIDNLTDDVANDFVITDEDNIGCTKNTEKGSNLYFDIEDTIKNALDKQTRKEKIK
tara:strand:+ start:74 stop:298 length:225 start_codon:yes stop_codon:yes gene_type:complete